VSKRESGVIRLAGRTLGIMTERSWGAGHGARVRWPDPQIARPGGAIGERRAHLTCQRVRAPDLLGLRNETRNLGWAYAARREYLLIKPPNLARRTSGPAPMTSSVGIGI
jgi:hypothetical protein